MQLKPVVTLTRKENFLAVKYNLGKHILLEVQTVWAKDKVAKT